MALAGLFQATALVSQVAKRGMVDHAPFESSIRSLFVREAERTEDVYGGVPHLRLGLEVVQRQLGGDAARRDVDLTRYTIALLHLERKVAKRKELLDKIAEGLEQANRQSQHYPLTHENVIARLADTYVNTISTLTPRIMVSGEHGHLQNPSNASKVRALLLAGIRSAVLWKQSGGSRLHFLLQRRRLLEETQRLLQRV